MGKSTPVGVHFRHIVCGIVNIGNSGILKREWQRQRPRRLRELHNKARYERMEILPNHPRYDYTDVSLAFYSESASFFVAKRKDKRGKLCEQNITHHNTWLTECQSLSLDKKIDS